MLKENFQQKTCVKKFDLHWIWFDRCSSDNKIKASWSHTQFQFRPCQSIVLRQPKTTFKTSSPNFSHLHSLAPCSTRSPSHLASISPPIATDCSAFNMTEVLSPAPPTEAMDKLSLDSQSTSPAATLSSHEPLTVFHDPKNFNVKHPLMNTWTLWFTKTPTATGPKESWADLLKEVITFDSVEEFWGYAFLSRRWHLWHLIYFYLGYS